VGNPGQSRGKGWQWASQTRGRPRGLPGVTMGDLSKSVPRWEWERAGIPSQQPQCGDPWWVSGDHRLWMFLSIPLPPFSGSKSWTQIGALALSHCPPAHVLIASQGAQLNTVRPSAVTQRVLILQALPTPRCLPGSPSSLFLLEMGRAGWRKRWSWGCPGEEGQGTDQPHSTPASSSGHLLSSSSVQMAPPGGYSRCPGRCPGPELGSLPQGPPGLRICIPWLLISYS